MAWETTADAQRRMEDVCEKYPSPLKIMFTHSTFTADVFEGIRPCHDFKKASSPHSPNGGAWWDTDIVEAGLYELQKTCHEHKLAYFYNPSDHLAHG